jgi:hypothetical protein
MSRKNEAGRYLLAGLTPQEIGGRMGISLGSIRQYLCTLVGEGRLLRSDIAFNIAERQQIEAAIQDTDRMIAQGRFRNYGTATNVKVFFDRNNNRISPDLIELYLLTRDARPDLYTLICQLEVLLHRLVMETLQSAFGQRWWRDGIPEATRKSCQSRREEDNSPLDEPYHYTTFIELKSIIDSNWRVFSNALPKALTTNKQDFLQRLQRANGVRNHVMHPVKPISTYEDDYRFVRKLLADFTSKLENAVLV